MQYPSSIQVSSPSHTIEHDDTVSRGVEILLKCTLLSIGQRRNEVEFLDAFPLPPPRYSPRYRPNFRSQGTLLCSIDSRPENRVGGASCKVVCERCVSSRVRALIPRWGEVEEEADKRRRKQTRKREGKERERERERVKGSRRRCWVGNPGFLERS